MTTALRARIVPKESYPEAVDRLASSAVKAQQRDRVIAHVLRHHQKRIQPQFFSLPGSRWSTENILFEEWEQACHFVGVEKNWGVLARGIPWMPGTDRIFYHETMRNGSIQCARSSHVNIAHYEMNDFLAIDRTMIRDKQHRHQWGSAYGRWTACWLDGWSPVGSTMLPSLMRLDKRMSMDAVCVPVAITFLIGRDDDWSVYTGADPNSDALTHRVEAIRSILDSREYRKFRLDDAWSYSDRDGLDGGTMGVVLGRMCLR